MASWFSWLSVKSAKSAELKEAEEAFTAPELKELDKHWQEALVRQAGGRAPSRDAARRGIDGAHFAALVGPIWPCLEPLLQSQLLRLVADPADGRVHLAGLIVAKARLERLGEEAALEFTYRLVGPDGGGLSYTALEAAAVSCLRLTGALPPTPQPAPHPPPHYAGKGATEVDGGAVRTAPAAPPWGEEVQSHIAAVCHGALAFASDRADAAAAADVDVAAARMSYDKYCQWTKRCPALHKALSGVLRHVGAAAVGTGASASASAGAPGAAPVPWLLPCLVQLGNLAPAATLLQPVWTWVLSSRLPPAQRAEWRLLFSSQRDGKSFNTFFGRVSAATASGPTLLLVRDKGGAVFGGYASQPWAKSGTYFGDVASFIFALKPALRVFPATGINTNFQWCGVGFSQLPGGLGFGGAANGLGHFALYIEPSLDSGMSRPIATYGNCPLASEQVFQVDTLECWLLQPPEEEEGDVSGRGDTSAGGLRRGGNSGSTASVLTKAAEDRAIMQMAGMKMHSEGLRDEPLEED